MDAECVTRGGILAEAASFLLIAPEIIGIERLRRIESRLENVFREPSKAFSPQARSRWRNPMPAPQIPDDWLGWVAEYLNAAVLIVGMAAGALIIFGRGAAVLLLFVIGASLLMTACGIWLSEHGPRRVSRPVSYVLMSQGIAPIYLLRMSEVVTYVVLRSLPLAAARLLTGPDRLRGLVFGTGIVLLFGGMTAQFAATF